MTFPLEGIEELASRRRRGGRAAEITRQRLGGHYHSHGALASSTQLLGQTTVHYALER